MKIKQQLNAFTILEVTIAMIISAISMGIAYSAYTIMKQSYRQYDQRNKQIAELVLADKLLKKDFSEAKHIFKKGNELVLISARGSISYELNELYILRNQNNARLDTFNLPVKNSSFYYVNDSKLAQLVKRMDVETTVEDNDIIFHYEKKYSAGDLMSEESTHTDLATRTENQ